MFIGHLSQLEFTQSLSPALKQLIQRVAERLQSPIEDGRYELEGDAAFFFVTHDHTQLRDERIAECHRRYLDVQILLQGKETFGYGVTLFDGLDDDRLEQRDIAFSKQQSNERFVDVEAGDFVIFYPGQPHRPLIATDDQPMPIRKAVIKVDKALFL